MINELINNLTLQATSANIVCNEPPPKRGGGGRVPGQGFVWIRSEIVTC